MEIATTSTELIADIKKAKMVNRIKELTHKETSSLGYLYLTNPIIIGCMSTVFDKAGVPHVNPIPKEYKDAFVEALYEEFYGGCEPEFETEEQYDQHNATLEKLMKAEYKKVTDHTQSPYKDKTVPYLAYA